MKQVLIISTGGTIGCKNSENGLTPSLAVEDFIARLSQKELSCNIVGEQLMNIDSANMQPKDWISMVKVVKVNYQQCDGFVITHGTDTLSYTAAALSYLIQFSNKPIVLTGSQKPITFKSTDAIDNLTDSIFFACQKIGGVFVTFNKKLILGTQVRKVKTRNKDAFISLNKPYVAILKQGNIEWNNKLVNKINAHHKTPQFYTELNENVLAIKLFPGLKPDALVNLAKTYDALVLEAYGSGNLPFVSGANFTNAIQQLVENGCIVLVCTQVQHEGTNMQHYEAGREALKFPNILEGNLLSVECGITKLMWALAQETSFNGVSRLMNTTIQEDRQ